MHLVWVVKDDKLKNYRFLDRTGNKNGSSYENDDYIRATLLQNKIESSIPDKRFHNMNQSPIEAEYCIEMLTPINGLVLDPMLGEGTTAVACRNKERRFIGIDKDPKAIQASKYNLALNVSNEKRIA